MTARLSHWNTVEIFDYGRTDDGTFFYVMEYLPGLEPGGPARAPRAAAGRRASSACCGKRVRGCAEAHAIGLIHRDIKPGQRVRGPARRLDSTWSSCSISAWSSRSPSSPSARLTQDGGDFRHAAVHVPRTGPRSAGAGRPQRHLLPGRRRLRALDRTPAVRRPESDGSDDRPRARRCDAVTHRRPGVPADLEAIILRCLAKSPEDRFQDVESLEQALADCAAADEWTQSHAARWWREHDQAGTSLPEPCVRSRSSVPESRTIAVLAATVESAA